MATAWPRVRVLDVFMLFAHFGLFAVMVTRQTFRIQQEKVRASETRAQAQEKSGFAVMAVAGAKEHHCVLDIKRDAG